MKMVKYAIFSILLGSMTLCSCSDEVRVLLDIPDADSYSSIYMPSANNVPNMESIYIMEEVQSFPLIAYYGGPQLPGNDVRVDFEIRMDLVEEYNTLHGTAYEPMPEGSYQLSESSSYIKSGTERSVPVNIDVVSMGYMEVAKSYLLPVGIKSVGGEVPVVESLRTTYFLFTGSYQPGQVPREKVYSFHQAVSKPIFCREQDLIRVTENNTLQLYELNADGVYEASRQIAEGWDGVDLMFYMPENRFIYRNPATNIVQISVDEDYTLGTSREIGWGWGGAKMVFPFKDLALIAVNGANITKYPLNQNGDFDFANCADIESSGWDSFIDVFCYGNNIMAIEPNGNLWAIPITDDYVIGTRRQVGTGWDMYVKVFPCGEDLLALDENGDLWRYRFDPAAYWPLKVEE